LISLQELLARVLLGTANIPWQHDVSQQFSDISGEERQQEIFSCEPKKSILFKHCQFAGPGDLLKAIRLVFDNIQYIGRNSRKSGLYTGSLFIRLARTRNV